MTGASGPKEKKFIVRVETLTSRGPTTPYTMSMFGLWDHSRLSAFSDIWLIPPSLRQCSDIPIGRNLCIEKDIDQLRWDAWLWIDDDHEFKPEVVWSLIEAMRRGQVDIVSPLVGHKSEDEPGRPVVFEKYDEALGLWNIMYTGWEKPDLYEVAAVGTGFQLVARRVFEKMPRPWYERVRNPRRRDQLHGNDVNFCTKAKELGFRVWLDSRVEIGHANMKCYYPRKDYVEGGFQKKRLIEMRTQRPISPSTKEDVNEPSMWDDYYGRQGWGWREHREDVLKEVVSRIPDEASVLHFGCGEGWISEQLSKRGENVKVFGLDHSVNAIGLTRKRGVDCKLISRMSDFHANGDGTGPKYDYIVITDWLERLPDPEATLTELLKCYGHPQTQIVTVVPALTLAPEDVPEHHHIFSEWNLGQFMDRFGRPLEIAEFKERIFGPDGEVMHEVPRYVSRSTVEKVMKTDAAVSIV